MKSYYIKLSVYIALSLIVFPLASLYADELSDLKKKVDQQQKEINELRQDLERLEQSESSGEPMYTKPMFGANLGLFGDINFTTNSREKSKSSFYIGEADLYSTASYGDRLTFLTEIAIEGDAQGFELDLERLWVGYTFSDLLIVRAGKHHTALGYWNKTYHHGKQFFLTVDRPFFLTFEHDGGVLPIHIIGMEFEGRWAYDFARFKYEFNVGNGPRINQSTMMLAQNDLSDDNSSKQIALRISGRPNALEDLNIGVFGTVFTVDTTLRSDLDEKIYGIDAAYTHNKFELLTEYFWLVNSDASSSAFYAQVGYNIVEDVTPYLRFESLNRDGGDPFLSNLEGGFDRRQVIAGVKYDIDVVKSSIKTQYRYDDTVNGNDHNVFEVQWSFGF